MQSKSTAIFQQSVTLALAVIQQQGFVLLDEPGAHGVFNDTQVAEDILVRHLDTEGPLAADATNGGRDVHSVDVLQATQADVNGDEGTCRNRHVLNLVMSYPKHSLHSL